MTIAGNKKGEAHRMILSVDSWPSNALRALARKMGVDERNSSVARELNGHAEDVYLQGNRLAEDID